MRIMLAAWSSSDNESIYSSHESYSDKIDSDIEAELYSSIHHQEKCSSVMSDIDSIVQKDDNMNSQNNQIISSKESSLQTMNHFLSDVCENSIFYSSFESPVKTHLYSNKNCAGAINAQCTINTHVKNNTKFSELEKNYMKNVWNKTSNKNKHDDSIKKRDKNMEWVEVESNESDSDNSVIWIDPKETPRNFKTNLLTVNISGESSNRDVNFLSTNDKVRWPCINRRNMSLPNMKLEENSKDVWHVDEEDIFTRSKRSLRFFNKTFNSSCSMCGKQGHSESKCIFKRSKCFICGGQHNFTVCKKKLCSKCYGKGHDVIFCRVRHSVECSHCKMRNHPTNRCPDIWRRYHLTTNSADIVKGKPLNQNTPIYCFNCGHEGHFGSHCKDRRKHLSFPTWPSVISYNSSSTVVTQNMKENEMKRNQKRLGQNLRKKQKRERKKEMCMKYKLKKEKLREENQRSLKQHVNNWKKKKLTKGEPSFPRSPKDTTPQQNDSVDDEQALQEIQFSWRRKGKRSTKRERNNVVH